MEWINALLWNSDNLAHIVCLFAFVIATGVLLGKIKFFGISLGVTWVLFMGIFMGHFGFGVSDNVLHFIKEFGLILFVYCIGLQVGPSFFSSFKKGGLPMNIIAMGIIALNVVVMLALFYIFEGGEKEKLPMMVGVMCGAITNTPALGAATNALKELNYGGDPIALGYACAYPLGVVGIILSTLALKTICKLNLKKEENNLEDGDANNKLPHLMHVEVTNESLNGKNITDIIHELGHSFVCSRIKHDNHVSIPNKDTKIYTGDQLFIISTEGEAEYIANRIGNTVQVDWEKEDRPMVSRRILITKNDVNGKTISQLNIRNLYGVNISRVHRSGIDLYASPELMLQIGDKVTVVGEEDSVERLATRLGNEMKRLDHPNIVTIFIGIFLGLILGSLPIAIPGMSTPVKLGLAGGPLVAAILIGRFGYKLKLITYTTNSANLMLREIGICLFLAAVGIGSGEKFVHTIMNGGLAYVGYGVLITVLPIIIMGIIAVKVFKINYFKLMGLIAGSNTDPPALAFANSSTGNDAPAVGYTTVYPLTMFLRIIVAQLIVLTMYV